MKNKMNLELRENEHVLKQGFANFKKGIKHLGGKLYLTDQRVAFRAHSLNIQNANVDLELNIVSSIQPRWTRFLGIPLFPNTLEISTNDGETSRFVLNGRTSWAIEISNQIHKSTSAKKN